MIRAIEFALLNLSRSEIFKTRDILYRFIIENSQKLLCSKKLVLDALVLKLFGIQIRL